MSTTTALDALAMDFEGEALDESNTARYRDLRRAAAQIRCASEAITQGTYTDATGAAWLTAGRLTLDRLRKTRR